MKHADVMSDVEDGKRALHELKTWPAYFGPISEGLKPFEVRRDDRGFQKGDVLHLREYDPSQLVPSHRFTGNGHFAVVTYVLTGGQFGIEPGYVVMGLEATTD